MKAWLTERIAERFRPRMNERSRLRDRNMTSGPFIFSRIIIIKAGDTVVLSLFLYIFSVNQKKRTQWYQLYETMWHSSSSAPLNAAEFIHAWPTSSSSSSTSSFVVVAVVVVGRGLRTIKSDRREPPGAHLTVLLPSSHLMVILFFVL